VRPASATIETITGPYAIPQWWRWVRLDETIDGHVGGGTPSKGNSAYWDGDIYWASVKDIGPSKYLNETIDRITPAGLADSSSHLVPPGHLIAVTRMGLGKVAINRVPVAINQDLRALQPSPLMDVEYQYIFLKTHAFQGTGLTVKGIRLTELLHLPFPLPPLAEQRRIVIRIDELWAVCDELDVAREKRESTRSAATASVLATVRATARDEVSEAAASLSRARLCVNALPGLITRPDQIAAIRKTILDLAALGRLESHDPADEPAPSQFQGILRDRQTAIANGVFRAITNVPDSVLVDWDIPSHWLVVPLPSAVYFQEGPGLRNWQFRSEGVPFLNIRTLEGGRVNRALCQFLDPAEVEQKYQHFLVRTGDILCSTSGTIGKLAVVADTDLPLMLNTSIVRFAPYGQNGPDPGFIKIFLGTDLFLEQAQRSVTGSAQVNMGPSHLKAMAFPLPPLAEQRRIVVKVEAMMRLCDELHVALTIVQSKRVGLLEAALAEWLGSGADVVRSALTA
jgi:type I restriction enzyme S subunit